MLTYSTGIIISYNINGVIVSVMVLCMDDNGMKMHMLSLCLWSLCSSCFHMLALSLSCKMGKRLKKRPGTLILYTSR